MQTRRYLDAGLLLPIESLFASGFPIGAAAARMLHRLSDPAGNG